MCYQVLPGLLGRGATRPLPTIMAFRRKRGLALLLITLSCLVYTCTARLRGGYRHADLFFEEHNNAMVDAAEDAAASEETNLADRNDDDDDIMDFDEQSPTLPRVMVFGGNGFIGASVVDQLLKAGFYVVVVNRNTTYFDNYERVQYRVEHILWDRSAPLMQSQQLELYFEHHPVLHAVVDLSGYDADAAFDLGNQLLSYRVGWMIYVSSDSVYEACAKKTHTGPTREEDAVRDEALQLRLEGAVEGEDEGLDVYGHNKLAAEEQFRDLREETKEDPNGWGYVALRLSDVVGPRDTSYRWWFYQILIRLQETLHVPLPVAEADDAEGGSGRQLSLVYVEDVARAIVWLISAKNQQVVIDRPLNLASTETMTFKQLMSGIAGGLGVKAPLKYERNATTELPSVKRGPIDISKAKSLMNWHSTPWPQVFAETVPWFEGAMLDPRFSRERDDVLTWVYRHVSKHGKQRELQRALRAVYGLKESVVDRLVANETAAGLVLPEPPPEVVMLPEDAVSKMEL